MLSLNSWLAIIGIIVLLSGGGYLYWKGQHDQANKQAMAQLQHSQKVRKQYDKIDQTTPFDGDKQSAIDWLLQHGRQ